MISKESIKKYLNRELDNFGWMKKLSREEIMSALEEFSPIPEFSIKPWLHQIVCIYIGLCRRRFLFLLKPGKGKTFVALKLITQAKSEGGLKRTLVTVPRLINLDTWREATEEHSNLVPHMIEGTIEEKWNKLLNPRGDITIIDYPGLQLALSVKGKDKKGKIKLLSDENKISQLRSVYNFFVIDEIHKCKNWNTLRFSILRSLTKNADYCYGLTGTLFGRDPQDIWAQFFLIDRGETFGEHLNIFRAAFFKEVNDFWKGISFVFDKDKTEELHRFLQHKSISYSDEEIPDIDIPPLAMRRIEVKFTSEQYEHYKNAIDGVINAKGLLRDIDGAFIRLRQITSGFLQWRDEYGDHCIEFDNNPKLQALERFLEDTEDEKVIISTEYTKSGEMISKLAKKMKLKFEWLYGGTKDHIATVNRFKKDPTCKLLIMNSEAGGTGTDGLQKEARYLVFYESPLSPIAREQTLNRVHRPGQTKRTHIYDIVASRSIDKKIIADISEGKNLYESVVSGSFNWKSLME